MKHTDLPGPVELFRKSYALVRQNLRVYAFVYGLPAIMVVATAIQLLRDNQSRGWDWGHPFSTTFFGPSLTSDSSLHTAGAILSILAFFATIISYCLAVILNLRVTEGKKSTFSDLWNEFTRNWLWARLMGLGILTILILIVGFILIIIPGIILLWRLFLAPYILVDKKAKVMDALNMSWNMTKGYAWPIYAVILFSVVLSLPSAIPIIGGLISFLLGTAYAAAPALRYQELKNRS